MNYDVIALACEQLDYRDKLRLAQLLIQTARKEEETVNPQDRAIESKSTIPEAIVEEQEIDTISYVYERLLKLRPVKAKSLTNSIKAMFQFQGGISEEEVSDIVNELQHKKLVKLTNNKVEYND
ncbi:hypothetical protein WM008_23325 [Vibrio vulnificus]|uniref:hypothetical protein n=1 Tax=Vibrio vulnificus TaxID=672 RepID=UPI00063DBA66|nr:hypothetical protein [Vibrio vulnificus]KLI68651.1 hypothetical protein VVYB158_06475 [Vibrio vulnificus CladeA-yb158]